MDAGIDDACPGKVDGACDAIEQPGMVRRVYCDKRRAPGWIDLCRDRKRPIKGRGDLASVAFQNVRRFRDSLAFRETIAQPFKLRGAPAKLVSKLFLFGGDSLSSACLFVSEPKHLLGRLEKVGQ